MGGNAFFPTWWFLEMRKQKSHCVKSVQYGGLNMISMLFFSKTCIWKEQYVTLHHRGKQGHFSALAAYVWYAIHFDYSCCYAAHCLCDRHWWTSLTFKLFHDLPFSLKSTIKWVPRHASGKHLPSTLFYVRYTRVSS